MQASAELEYEKLDLLTVHGCELDATLERGTTA